MERRTLLLAAGSAAVFALVGCDGGTDIEVSRETEAADPPDTADEVLARAQLAPLPDDAESQLSSSGTISEFELWAVELSLTAPAAEIETWVLESYGDPDGVGRAWVTPQKVKDALDIDDVPDTWRIEEASVQGTPYDRIVLIDDAEPRTVRIRLSEAGN
ncbi:hypothetical protein GCM10009625_10300 [Brachybacterium fresconis]